MEDKSLDSLVKILRIVENLKLRITQEKKIICSFISCAQKLKSIQLSYEFWEI